MSFGTLAVKDANNATVTAKSGTDGSGFIAPAGVPVDQNGLEVFGSQGDLAWSGSGNGAVIGLLKAIWTKLSSVVVASGSTITVPAKGTYTDRSSTITTGGSSQQGAAVNANRQRIALYNPTDTGESLWYNWTSAASATVGSFELTPGGSYDSGTGPVSTEQLNLVATTTGHRYILKEM